MWLGFTFEEKGIQTFLVVVMPAAFEVIFVITMIYFEATKFGFKCSVERTDYSK